MELVRAFLIVSVSLSLLSVNAGCLMSSMPFGAHIPTSDQLQAEDSLEFDTTAVSNSDGVRSNNGILDLNDLKPEQHVRLVTRSSDEMKDQETGSDEIPNSLVMFFALEHVNGTIVSVDASRIVLRDVVITSNRDVDPPRKSFNLIPHNFTHVCSRGTRTSIHRNSGGTGSARKSDSRCRKDDTRANEKSDGRSRTSSSRICEV